MDILKGAIISAAGVAIGSLGAKMVIDSVHNSAKPSATYKDNLKFFGGSFVLSCGTSIVSAGVQIMMGLYDQKEIPAE